MAGAGFRDERDERASPIKYQTFISSTKKDLHEARQAVTWEILRIEFIPVGMENFSAMDERGWETIARVIDESDYYVLIVAGLYGTVDPKTGLSWTQREYEYARSKGVPILTFMQERSATRGDMVEAKPHLRKALDSFIAGLREAHHVEMWTTIDDLRLKVPVALMKHAREDERQQRRRPGWLRRDARIDAVALQAQKMEVVGQLASGVANDLHNMLGAMAGGIDALRRAQLDPDPMQDLQVVEDGYRRASALTRKLVAISRNQAVRLASTDVNATITSLESMLRRLASAFSDVDLVLDLDLSAHPAVTDEASLDQALANLVINARDAISGRGAITITTGDVWLGADAVRRGAPSEGDYVMIEVADTGCGMPPEVLRRIYEPFFTTKPAGKGTGLGLTMVYAFVTQCRGHIEVQSQVGKGTALRLYLRRGEGMRPERRRSAIPLARASKRAMILVVDDDPTIREVTRDQLQEGGYQVVTASDSSEAMNLVQTKGAEIALVLLDMNMPDMTGRELRQRLAEMRLPAKVLFVTGYSPEQVAEETGVEAERVLQKPFRLKDLLTRVRTILDA